MTALAGVRVICLGQFYFAPYCTMLLARLGADVIKIEAPSGDPYRRLGRLEGEEVPVQYGMVNSGKRSMRIDLKQTAGGDLVRRMALTADVLVQNLAPGATQRYGLDYDTLHALNPRLIVASGTGFGSFGPYAGQPAMDLTIQARTAIMSTTGFEDGPPIRTGPSVVDFTAGAHLAAGVLAALYQRTETGLGQHVEVSLQDAIIPSLTSNISGYVTSGGTMPERTGNRHGGLAATPYNAYETTDGWVSILCPTDNHWNRLCGVMQDPEASSDLYATNAQRVAAMDEVDELVTRWTKPRSKHDVFTALRGANVPAGPVVSLPELLDDPHVQAHGIVGRASDEQGSWWTLGSPLFLSDSPSVPPTRPSTLGENTEAILTDELGLSAAELAALRDAGVI